MKSIISIAALVAVAGSAAAQMQMVDANTPVDGALSTLGQKMAYRHLSTPSMTASLAGDTYSTTQNVYSLDDLNNVLLGVSPWDGSATNDSEFYSDGTTPGAFGPFDGIHDSASNVFFDDQALAWADSTDIPSGVTANTDPADPLALVVLDIDDATTVPGSHTILLRHFYSGEDASVGGGVTQFSPTSDDSTGLDTDQIHVPIVLGFNDAATTTVAENDSHPVAFTFALGEDGNGLDIPGGWDETTPVVWDYWNMLCFSSITGLFFRITLTDANSMDIVPTATFVGGSLTIEEELYFPSGVDINLVSGRDDITKGFGPFDLTANGGVPNEFMIPVGWQMQFTAVEAPVGNPCPADLADGFGSPSPDGVVDFGDFLFLLGASGPCPGMTPGCPGDIADGFGSPAPDGVVDFGDFLFMLGMAGPCP